MSRDKIRGFQERAANVTLACQETRRQYDDTPPRIDFVPMSTLSTVGRLFVAATWTLNRH